MLTYNYGRIDLSMQYYNPEFKSYAPIARDTCDTERDLYIDCVNVDAKNDYNTKCTCFADGSRDEHLFDVHAVKTVMCEEITIECKNSADMTLSYDFKTNKCQGDYSYYDDGGISGGEFTPRYMSYEYFKKYVFDEIHSQQMNIVAITYGKCDELLVCRLDLYNASISEEECKYLLNKAQSGVE